MKRHQWTALGTHLSAILIFGMLTAACACTKGEMKNGVSGAIGTAATQSDPSLAVAKVEGQTITLGDLDEHIGPQLRDLDEQRFQARSQGLDQLVSKQLVQNAAKKAQLSEEALLKREVDGKVKEPNDAEVKAFFDKNVASLPPDSKLADYHDRIVEFLSRKAHTGRAKEYFAELRKGAAVEISLTPPPKPRLNVEAKGPSRGPENAKVTLVEWSDFECPYCERGYKVVEQLMQRYPGKLRLVFRQFPLSFHAHARKAAEAALCGEAQGKFWEMHNAMFEDQSKLEVSQLKATAARLGLDKEKFAKCLDDGEMGKTVEADMAAAEKVGVSGTPAFFINGMMLSGAGPLEDFTRLIDAELK